MGDRPNGKFRPDLESLEAKQLLSALAASVVAAREARAARVADHVSAQGKQPKTGFLVYRITNPDPFNDKLVMPFTNVLVQSAHPPVRGKIYNILHVSVRNGTRQTFTAADGFTVKISDQPITTPVLTGDQQWKPGQEFVFYILTTKYYPLKNPVTSGFVFNFAGAKSVAVPGPAGIYLRARYDPSRFDRFLDSVVAFGPGAEGGSGIKLGLPVTSIYEVVSAKTDRQDFGGYF